MLERKTERVRELERGREGEREAEREREFDFGSELMITAIV